MARPEALLLIAVLSTVLSLPVFVASVDSDYCSILEVEDTGNVSGAKLHPRTRGSGAPTKVSCLWDPTPHLAFPLC